jgi:tetratricopeptide (TPR) repeat protein
MPGRLKWCAGLAMGFALLTLGGPAQSQTRPSGALGYSAAERRAVEAQLTRSETTRNKLAGALGLSRQLLRAIAQEVGFANPAFSDRQVLEAVEVMATRAKQLQADNARLRNEIEQLGDPTLRDPALALLSKAESALSDGQLAEAEALFGDLRELRWGERGAAVKAWDAAVGAQARTAELRQDYTAAEELRLSASQLQTANSAESDARAFRFALDAALARFDEGRIFGEFSAFARAAKIMEEWVLPLARATQDPSDIWEARYYNMKILRTLGDLSEGTLADNYYDKAFALFKLSTDKLDEENYPEFWRVSFQEAANLFISIAPRLPRQKGIAVAESAVETLDKLLEHYPRTNSPVTWASLQADRGEALAVLGEVRGGIQGSQDLKFALATYQDVLEIVTRASDIELWAIIQLRIVAVESMIGETSSGVERVAHWRAAEAAAQNALTFYTPNEQPARNKLVTSYLLSIRAALARADEY